MKLNQSIVADILEYAGMVALVVGVGAFNWRIGVIVLAACLIFVSYVLGQSNDANK